MEKNRPTTGIWVLVAVVILGIAFCIWAITAETLTDRESLLISIVLTVLASLASWITSHYYAEYSSNKNLKVFALKAAEKVTNLSSELDRLSVFLQQELEDEDFESTGHALLSRDGRIEGAIHVINTLKSVNDKSLSDWQGVIGDEIVARQEKQEEREEELKDLVDKLESLYETDTISASSLQHDDTTAIRLEMESIKSDVQMMASQISGMPIRRKKSLAPIEHLEAKCPQCSAIIQYQQRPKPNGMKGLTCKQCGASLVSRFIDDEFSIQMRIPLAEKVPCPACAAELDLQLDPLPGSSTLIDCPSCNSHIRVYRSSTAIGTKLIQKNIVMPMVPITENFLQQVKDAMPSQPWPKGASRGVAEKLHVSVNSVKNAVDELIRRDVFKAQFDGQLYVKEQNDE